MVFLSTLGFHWILQAIEEDYATIHEKVEKESAIQVNFICNFIYLEINNVLNVCHLKSSFVCSTKLTFYHTNRL